MAQLDYFIKIDGIPGESTDDKHKDEIEVLSFSFGAQHASKGSASTAGARTGGRVSCFPFIFTKVADKASPKLLEKCCNGTHIPKAVFTAHRATDLKQKYLQIDLTDLVVRRWKSAQETGVERTAKHQAGGGVMLQEELIELMYGSIRVTYTVTDHQTGKATGDVSAGWDQILNKKL